MEEHTRKEQKVVSYMAVDPARVHTLGVGRKQRSVSPIEVRRVRFYCPRVAHLSTPTCSSETRCGDSDVVTRSLARTHARYIHLLRFSDEVTVQSRRNREQSREPAECRALPLFRDIPLYPPAPRASAPSRSVEV